MRTGKQCKVCGCKDTILFFEKAMVPVFCNAMYKSKEAALNCPKGDLQFYGCTTCGFAWNDKFIPELLSYSETYENNQSFSTRFIEHLDAVTDLLPFSYNDCILVEVGCGQGYFLRHLLHRLSHKPDSHLKNAVGFDPAVRQETNHDGIQLVKGILNRNSWHAVVKEWTDVEAFGAAGQFLTSSIPVVSRHVIEHLEEPKEFVNGIIDAIDSFSFLALETPRLEWILDNKAYYDLYYEHCSLFTQKSLYLLLASFNFKVSTNCLLDGQYQVAIGHQDSPDVITPAESLSDEFIGSFTVFAESYLTFQTKWRKSIADLVAHSGPVALWGGASKAVAFTGILGRSAKDITCAFDINPSKVGHFLPGSGLPIVYPSLAALQSVQNIIIMNPVYFSEIEKFCSDLGVKPNLFVME